MFIFSLDGFCNARFITPLLYDVKLLYISIVWGVPPPTLLKRGLFMIPFALSVQIFNKNLYGCLLELYKPPSQRWDILQLELVCDEIFCLKLVDKLRAKCIRNIVIFLSVGGSAPAPPTQSESSVWFSLLTILFCWSDLRVSDNRKKGKMWGFAPTITKYELHKNPIEL